MNPIDKIKKKKKIISPSRCSLFDYLKTIEGSTFFYGTGWQGYYLTNMHGDRLLLLLHEKAVNNPIKRKTKRNAILRQEPVAPTARLLIPIKEFRF